jgi:hypothetical protein
MHTERTYNLRLPREAEVPRAGVSFTDSPKNYEDKSGSINEFLTLVYPQNSRVGIHASNDRKSSLCGLPMTAEVIDSGMAEKMAVKVTCQFCQARLVGAAVLDPDDERVSAYARDYGRRRPPLWLEEK